VRQSSELASLQLTQQFARISWPAACVGCFTCTLKFGKVSGKETFKISALLLGHNTCDDGGAVPLQYWQQIFMNAIEGNGQRGCFSRGHQWTTKRLVNHAHTFAFAAALGGTGSTGHVHEAASPSNASSEWRRRSRPRRENKPPLHVR